jgi:hypothetical protein
VAAPFAPRLSDPRLEDRVDLGVAVAGWFAAPDDVGVEETDIGFRYHEAAGSGHVKVVDGVGPQSRRRQPSKADFARSRRSVREVNWQKDNKGPSVHREGSRPHRVVSGDSIGEGLQNSRKKSGTEPDFQMPVAVTSRRARGRGALAPQETVPQIAHCLGKCLGPQPAGFAFDGKKVDGSFEVVLHGLHSVLAAWAVVISLAP